MGAPTLFFRELCTIPSPSRDERVSPLVSFVVGAALGRLLRVLSFVGPAFRGASVAPRMIVRGGPLFSSFPTLPSDACHSEGIRQVPRLGLRFLLPEMPEEPQPQIFRRLQIEMRYSRRVGPLFSPPLVIPTGVADFFFRTVVGCVGHAAEGPAFHSSGFAGWPTLCAVRIGWVRSSSSLFRALSCSAGFYASELAVVVADLPIGLSEIELV